MCLLGEPIRFLILFPNIIVKLIFVILQNRMIPRHNNHFPNTDSPKKKICT